MKTEEMFKLQAYLDNEVSSAEARQIATWIARDAEAKALYEELKATKTLLAPENEVAIAVPDSREFYWSKIQRGIERAEREPAPTHTPRPWWIRLLAPVAGTAALAFFMFTSVSFQTPFWGIQHEESNVADGTITLRSPDRSMTLVWISSPQMEADATAAEEEFED